MPLFTFEEYHEQGQQYKGNYHIEDFDFSWFELKRHGKTIAQFDENVGTEFMVTLCLTLNEHFPRQSAEELITELGF